MLIAKRERVKVLEKKKRTLFALEAYRLSSRDRRKAVILGANSSQIKKGENPVWVRRTRSPSYRRRGKRSNVRSKTKKGGCTFELCLSLKKARDEPRKDQGGGFDAFKIQRKTIRIKDCPRRCARRFFGFKKKWGRGEGAGGRRVGIILSAKK